MWPTLVVGTVPLRPADHAWGTHNKSLERTRPARAFGSIIVLPGRSAQPLCAARRRTVSFIFNISAPPEVIWECIARKDCSRPPSAKRLHSRGEPALKGGNDLQELPSSTAITDQHPSNICPCGRGHLWKTSCLQGPARRRPIRSGGRANDGSGESKPARVGWRRRADRRRCGRSLLLGAFPLRPADLGWGTHNKSLERTRPARAFRSIMVLPGRSAQPLGIILPSG